MDNSVNKSVFGGYKNKLANKLYGLLCEREKDGKWEEFFKEHTHRTSWVNGRYASNSILGAFSESRFITLAKL